MKDLEEVKKMLPLNLQFFAEGEEDNDDEEDDNQGGSGETDKNKETKEKTFTQAQVTAMMATEKKQGRRALLNDLGYKDEKSVKSNLASYKAFSDSQKSDEDKNKDAQSDLKTQVAEANLKVAAAETRAEALTLGVNKKYIDDVVVLILSKKSAKPDEDIKVVAGEIKKMYPSLFKEESSEEDEENDKKSKGLKGTGGKVNNVAAKGKKDSEEDNKSLGERLAAQRKANRGIGSEKKSFWNN